MKKVILSSLAISLAISSQIAFGYGAIAYSKSTGSYGYSYDASSKESAFESAIDYCGKSDCKAVLWVNDSCGALARKNNNISVIGTGWGSTRSAAIDSAHTTCGGGCKTVTSVCD